MMRSPNQRRWLPLWPAVLLVLVVPVVRLLAPSTSAQELCAPSTVAAERVPLADFTLLASMPPGSNVTLSRITLSPGETLNPTRSEYTAYYVASGVLQYKLQRGLSVFSSPACGASGGAVSSGGVIEVDANGMVSVDVGEALIAEDVPAVPLTNSGTTPLVLLEMMVVPAAIDPATGQPILDGATAGRIAAKERQQHRQTCKDAADASVVGETAATPPENASTADAESDGLDSRDHATRTPKACRE